MDVRKAYRIHTHARGCLNARVWLGLYVALKHASRPVIAIAEVPGSGKTTLAYRIASWSEKAPDAGGVVASGLDGRRLPDANSLN